jgi:hypothetical protein
MDQLAKNKLYLYVKIVAQVIGQAISCIIKPIGSPAAARPNRRYAFSLVGHWFEQKRRFASSILT